MQYFIFTVDWGSRGLIAGWLGGLVNIAFVAAQLGLYAYAITSGISFALI